jgi:hypothetical protein
LISSGCLQKHFLFDPVLFDRARTMFHIPVTFRSIWCLWKSWDIISLANFEILFSTVSYIINQSTDLFVICLHNLFLSFFRFFFLDSASFSYYFLSNRPSNKHLYFLGYAPRTLYSFFPLIQLLLWKKEKKNCFAIHCKF